MSPLRRRACDRLRYRYVIHPHPPSAIDDEEVRLGAQHRLLVAEGALRRRSVLGGSRPGILRGTPYCAFQSSSERKIDSPAMAMRKIACIVFRCAPLGVSFGVREPLMRHEVEAFAAVLGSKSRRAR